MQDDRDLDLRFESAPEDLATIALVDRRTAPSYRSIRTVLKISGVGGALLLLAGGLLLALGRPWSALVVALLGIAAVWFAWFISDTAQARRHRKVGRISKERLVFTDLGIRDVERSEPSLFPWRQVRRAFDVTGLLVLDVSLSQRGETEYLAIPKRLAEPLVAEVRARVTRHTGLGWEHIPNT